MSGTGKFPFWLLIIAFSGTKLLHTGKSNPLSLPISAVLCGQIVGELLQKM